MPTTTFELGDVTVTIDCPAGVVPALEVRFHCTEVQNDHETVIAALGGVAHLDPVNPIWSWMERTVTVDGTRCHAVVHLPDPERTNAHPIAAALKAAQRQAATP